MFPVSGSPTGDVHPTRLATMSVKNTLNRCSHSIFPVSASRHPTRSCTHSPSPTGPMKYMRPFMTIGVDRPSIGTFQSRFSPSSDHLVTTAFSRDMPVGSGPRQVGQSFASAFPTHARTANAANNLASDLVCIGFLLIHVFPTRTAG